VYGLGVLAHELLSGRSPFLGSVHAIRQAKLAPDGLPPVAPGRTDVPSALRELITQMIAVDPQDRPRTMEDVVLRLHSIRSQCEAGRGPLAAIVADDDDDTRRAIAALIEVEVPDAEVVTVQDGPSALRAVRRRVPDALFLDLDMPGMNGIEVCMTLRGMQIADRCEVVLVSGRASRADEQLLRHLGVRCIPKGPRLAEEIPRIVRRLRRGESAEP